MLHTHISSPVGDLFAVCDGSAITELSFDEQHIRSAPARARGVASAFAALREQLAGYFAGELRAFDLPLAPAGSAFEQRVWRLLRSIPYGATTSYGAIARALEMPNAARAVGLANARNPIVILIPCHRVIGADGSLTGYGGGLARKRLLLDLETSHSGLFEPLSTSRV